MGKFNLRDYYVEREEKRKYWADYARKVLADPRATHSECKTAAIGVGSFDKDLEQKLLVKKGKPPRY
jgi:hypothetical protein